MVEENKQNINEENKAYEDATDLNENQEELKQNPNEGLNFSNEEVIVEETKDENSNNKEKPSKKKKKKSDRPKGKKSTFVFAIIVCIVLFIGLLGVAGAGILTIKLCED